VVLTGGVGGAKLVLGLQHVVEPASITAIVNTGDDFRHFGLAVSPDIDTLLYTLSGKANAAQGWGRAGETWSFMAAARELGGPGWFQLGDGDLALHILRSDALARGRTLSEVTRGFATAMGIEAAVLPMSDDPVSTMVETDEAVLEFQRYFVEFRCEPEVRAIRFEGAAISSPAPGVIEAITSPNTQAILVAPSNPFLSIDPILVVPGIAEALTAALAPIVAVSPIVGGQAVKGPTAKLMREFGLKIDAATIAGHYAPWLDGILVDERDPEPALSIPCGRADTLMNDLPDRIRVARAALDLARRIGR